MKVLFLINNYQTALFSFPTNIKIQMESKEFLSKGKTVNTVQCVYMINHSGRY